MRKQLSEKLKEAVASVIPVTLIVLLLQIITPMPTNMLIAFLIGAVMLVLGMGLFSLGADIAMAFDECAPADCDRSYTIAAMNRTHRWAKRCKESHTREDQALFGIVQGGMFADLRIESAKVLSDMDFPGYGIGGLSVGEPKPVMYEMLEQLMPHMPANTAQLHRV